MAWLKLRATLVLVGTSQARMDEIAQTKLAARRSSIDRLKNGAASHDLHLDSVSALEFEEDQLKRRIRQLEKERRALETKFLEARREREIVENAVRSKKKAYEAERNRRLQMIMDDETLQRRARERNGSI